MSPQPASSPIASQKPGDGSYDDAWPNQRDRKLLIRATKNYIVVIDKNGNIDWETTTEADADLVSRPNDNKKYTDVISEAATLETAIHEGWSEKTTASYLRLIGEAIANSLEGHFDRASATLAQAASFYQRRCEETSRSWYLSASFCVAAPFGIVGFLAWCIRNWLIASLGATAFWLVLCACAGATGALLSVIWRTGKLRVDCSAGRNLHWLEAGSRIAAGVVSGLLGGLAVHANLLFTPLTEGGRLHLIMLLVALTAGAGERLASSIISKFDAGDVKTAEKKK